MQHFFTNVRNQSFEVYKRNGKRFQEFSMEALNHEDGIWIHLIAICYGRPDLLEWEEPLLLEDEEEEDDEEEERLERLGW